MQKNKVLFTGAGFSRNWEGWLSSEITYRLLKEINKGPPEIIDEYYKQLSADQGNYETVLQEFQKLHLSNPENVAFLECLTFIEDAIRTCFFEMDRLYDGKFPAISTSAEYNAEVFLANFDYIFTLNQDLLIEKRFINLFSRPIFNRTYNPNRHGIVLPGIRGNLDQFRLYDLGLKTQNDLIIEVIDEPVNIARESVGFLPYIKLHGSYNWQTMSGNRLIISGGNKNKQINEFSLLNSYLDFFSETIKLPDTLIVAIGYGFNDKHINDALLTAFKNGGAQLYINHPRGLNSMPSGFIKSLHGQLYDSEQRTLREIFSDINQARLLFHRLFSP